MPATAGVIPRSYAAIAGLLTGASLGCSSLYPVETPQGCVVDADCQDAGFVCGAGICYAGKLPPRSHIGLDVLGAGLATNFRVELHGEDSAVLRIDRSPIRYSVSLDDRKQTPGVRDKLQIALRETYASGATETTIPLAGVLTFSQASRLGREAVTITGRRIDLVDGMGEPIEDAKLVLPWARYDRDPLGQDIPLVLTVNADDGIDEVSKVDVHRGPVYRQLVRPQLGGVGLHAFTINTRRECHRLIRGIVIIGATKLPVSSVDLEFKHARHATDDGNLCEPEPAIPPAPNIPPALCSPTTVVTLDGLPECISVNDCPAPYGCHETDADDGSKRCGCNRDSECPSGQICETNSKRCALDLGGLVAARDKTIDDTNAYDAWVYTHCDDDIEADRELDFVVTATPRGKDAPVPSLAYRTQIDFLWGNGTLPPADPKQVCLPDWAPMQPVGFNLTSDPQVLYTGADGLPWTCCSPACLDSEVKTPPTAPATCPLVAVVTASTLFTPDPVTWKANSCMELDRPDPLVPEGAQRVTYGPFPSCAQDGTECTISLSPGSQGLEYLLRVEPPVGSLIRSTILPPQVVDAGTPTVVAPPLAYRVLLRGRVELDPSLVPAADDEKDPTSGCPLNAEIMAERLRLPDEDPATAPGPHFYTARTIPGSPRCDFVLPVNPGVYLITAVPQTGSPGGPAKISVLDLREGSDLVDSSGPIPIAELAAPIVMEPGTLVTIELDNFDRSSVAVPLDLAGWVPIAGYPDLDLNRLDTCHGALSRGCEIRRLRPSKAGLSPTQEQYVKYLTRVPASQ